MRRLSTLFSTRTVFGDRDDCLIRLPKIGVTCTTSILGRNRAPELATGDFITSTKRIANNLPGLSTQCQPNPDFIRLFCNEGPEFIEFQGVRVWFTWVRIDQGCLEWREAVGFFFSQLITVLRATPNVRSNPRNRSCARRAWSDLTDLTAAPTPGILSLWIWSRHQRVFSPRTGSQPHWPC